MITPKVDNPLEGKFVGDITVDGELFTSESGVIHGSVRVIRHGRFINHGIITGNVYIDNQSSAVIKGLVLGSVTGDGDILIAGEVKQITK